MNSISRPIAAVGRPVARAGLGPIVGSLLSGATALVILGACLVLLLLPLYMHAALEAAGSAAYLGLAETEARRLSDLTVGELVLGPGTFAFAAEGQTRAFYDPAEAAHLRDARTVLYGFLVLVISSGMFVGVSLARSGRRRPEVWRGIARGAGGLAIGLAAAGVFALVAFDAAFELFHRVFFPGGNWAFDPTTQRLVQLYPLPFWQITTGALGGLAIAASVVVWAIARRNARTVQPPRTVQPARTVQPPRP
ncbi:hypothetical protein BH20CHL6_BH20CHL6_16290 [soil metagenome]